MEDMTGFDDGMSNAFGGFSQFDSASASRVSRRQVTAMDEEVCLLKADVKVTETKRYFNDHCDKEFNQREGGEVDGEELMDMFMDEMIERVPQQRTGSRIMTPMASEHIADKEIYSAALTISCELTQSFKDEVDAYSNQEVTIPQKEESLSSFKIVEVQKIDELPIREPLKKFHPPFIASTLKQSLTKKEETTISEPQRVIPQASETKKTPQAVQVNMVKLKRFAATPLPSLDFAQQLAKKESKVILNVRPASIRPQHPTLSTNIVPKAFEQPRLANNSLAVNIQIPIQRPVIDPVPKDKMLDTSISIAPKLEFQKQVKMNPESVPAINSKPSAAPSIKLNPFPSLQSGRSLGSMQVAAIKPVPSMTLKPLGMQAPISKPPIYMPTATPGVAVVLKSKPQAACPQPAKLMSDDRLECQLKVQHTNEHVRENTGKLFQSGRVMELDRAFKSLREDLLKIQENNLKCSYMASRLNSIMAYIKNRVRHTDREVSHFIGQP
jgi:hypothetical protein